MALTVTLELSSDVEAEVRTSIAHQDGERLRSVLLDALTPTVEALLHTPSTLFDDPVAWERLADQLLDSLSAVLPQSLPVLSDAATRRDSIYAEHP